MHVYIGADHRGFERKEALIPWLKEKGYEVTDCGNAIYDPLDDFPDFSFKVADGVAGSPGSLGILICGSGGGVTIAANKVAGIRCVTAARVEDVKHNRAHDDANVVAIAANYTTQDETKVLIEAFLTTGFSGEEKYVRRIQKIAAREGGTNHG